MSETQSATPNIYQRLNKVREAVAFIGKDKQVGKDGWGYKAVTHDAVTAAVRPHFVEQGVMVVPSVVNSAVVPTGTTTGKGVPFIRYEARFSIDFINCDDPQDKVSVQLDAHAIDDADKAPGKATSYATKYAMLKLLSIETGEEEEERPQQKKANMSVAEQVKYAGIKPTAGVEEGLTDQEKAECFRISNEVTTAWDEGNQELAVNIWLEQGRPLPADMNVLAWREIPSHIRRAIKERGKEAA